MRYRIREEFRTYGMTYVVEKRYPLWPFWYFDWRFDSLAEANKALTLISNARVIKEVKV